jgi:hypothetical protein
LTLLVLSIYLLRIFAMSFLYLITRWFVGLFCILLDCSIVSSLY